MEVFQCPYNIRLSFEITLKFSGYRSGRGRFIPLPDHRDTSLISRHSRSMTVARRMPARASTAVALRAYRAKKHPKDFSLRCFLSFLVNYPYTFKTTYKESIIHTYSRFGYALDLLVTVSSMRYRTSTSALSTSSSSRGLTNLTLWDISS